MKETGIIMSGDHPKLILDSRKTMTRRVIKPQPLDSYLPDSDIINKLKKIPRRTIKIQDEDDPTFFHIIPACPYGQVGDLLWVRETWAAEKRLDYLKPSDIGNAADVPLWWKATPIQDFSMIGLERGKWRFSRFMPRWASRITLEITEVRVERVQEITDKDCYAEGCPSVIATLATVPMQGWFRHLWDSLNAKRGYGWEVNPWLWVISFKVKEV